MSDFITIVITSPYRIKDEAEKIVKLLKTGVDFIHIRKPDWTIREVKDLIEDIPYRYRQRLRLHGHFELIAEMNLAGVQINSRNPVAPLSAKSISASCHTLEEVKQHSGLEYVTLSPIYDSISKPGYLSKYNPDKIKSEISGRRVIALGGVTPEHYISLKEKGFYGAALLGYIWDQDFESAIKTLGETIHNLRNFKQP